MPPLSQDAVRLFEDLIRHEVDDKAIPSISYALVGADGLLAEGHVQHPTQGFAMGGDTCFRIGSITKSFTAMAIMQLVEQGLVELDVDVAEYLPGFHPRNPFAGHERGPFGSAITLRKLMSHTAGIAREPASGHYLDATRPPLADMVAELAESTLKLDPSLGTMQYSNAGIAVVGFVIEKLTGHSYSAYVTEHILTPLGMMHSAVDAGPGVLDRLAPASMWTLEGDSPAPVIDRDGSPSGSIFSTTGDMANYVQCLLRGGFARDGSRIISPGSLHEMWTPLGKRMAYGKPIGGYGLCLGVGSMDGWFSVGHGGLVYGYASQMALLPTAGLGALVFVTLDSAGQIGKRLAHDGLRIVLAERQMGTWPGRPRKPAAIGARRIAALPGFYRNADSGEIVEVCAREDRLYLMGDGVPLQIRPAGGDAFVIDGRIFGRDADYPHMDLSFPGDGQLVWKDVPWARIDHLPAETVPPALAPHLGAYGPDFGIVHLTYGHGTLKCLIEHFYTHDCEPAGGDAYRMRGLLYDEEILELNATDDEGRKGIRVGPMFLERRD